MAEPTTPVGHERRSGDMTSSTSTRAWALVLPLAICALVLGAAACTPSATKADKDAPVSTTEVVAEALLEPVAPEITEPPVTEPPVTEPPVTEPPVTEPPVTEPPVTEPPVTEPPAPVTTRPAPAAAVYYANCAAARAAGAAPVYRGQPGYGTHLDRDGDGVGCE